VSLSAPTPDLAGFAAAQAKLRTFFGRDVRFYGPGAFIYDPATPASAYDDEGFPLDPLVGASAVNAADVGVAGLTIVGSAHANVLFQPLAAMRRDETQEDRLGIRSRLNKDLMLDVSDLSQASGGTYYELGTFARDPDGSVTYPEEWTPDDGELWKVVNLKVDGVGAVQRVIIFGQGTL
jgi:hypothetical protein